MTHPIKGDTILIYRRIGPARQRPCNLRRLGTSHNAKHTRQRFCLSFVNTDNFCMCVRASKNGCVSHVSDISVVGVNPAANKEPRILNPLHAFANIIVGVPRLFSLPTWRNICIQTHLLAPRMVSAANSMASTMV